MADEARTTEPVGVSTDGVLTEMTAEIVAAYVTHNHMQAGDVPGLIVAVHAALDGVARPARPDAAPSRSGRRSRTSTSSAAAIGEACGMGPRDVRARLAQLESQRHVVSRPDGLAKPPCRVFLVTAEGRRRIGA